MNLTKDSKNAERLKGDLDTIQRTVNQLRADLTAAQSAIAALQANSTRVIIQPNSNVTSNNKTFFTGIVVQPNTGLSGKGTQASPLSGSPTQPDTLTIKNQASLTGAFDSQTLRFIPHIECRWFLSGNALNSAATIATSNGNPLAFSGSSGMQTLAASGIDYNILNATTSGGVAAINATTGFLPALMAAGTSRTWVWNIGFLTAGTLSSLADIRLRFGFYASALGNTGTQPTAGAGIRYVFDDGTSPSQWVLEQWDQTAARTTSAKFGNVTLGHEYRIILKFSNISGSYQIAAEVLDRTTGVTSTSTLAVITNTPTFCVSFQALQMRLINTNATNARQMLLGPCYAYTSGD